MLDTIETIIFSLGGFRLKQVTQLGTKTNNGNRLDAIYTKSYTSQKYNGIGTLERMTINFSSYLVFSIFNKDNNSMEEVYFSIPHLTEMKNFLKDTIDYLVNTKDIYTKNGINDKYSNLTFESNTLISGKKVAIIPQKIQYNEFFEDGIIFFCNDDDHYAEINLNNFISLYEIIDSFSIIDFIKLGENAIILSRTNGENISSSGNSSRTSFSRTSNTSNTRTAFNRNNNSPRFSRKKDEEVTEEQIDEDIDNIIDTEEEKAKTSFRRRSVNKENKDEDTDNSMSLDNIMKTAEKISADDIDIESDVTFD